MGIQSLLSGQGLIGRKKDLLSQGRRNYLRSLVLRSSHLWVPKDKEGFWQLGSLLRRDGTGSIKVDIVDEKVDSQPKLFPHTDTCTSMYNGGGTWGPLTHCSPGCLGSLNCGVLSSKLGSKPGLCWAWLVPSAHTDR